MNVPKDSVMLLSFINSKLRDEFSSFEVFCNYYNLNMPDVEEQLKALNYFYNISENQFKMEE